MSKKKTSAVKSPNDAAALDSPRAPLTLRAFSGFHAAIAYVALAVLTFVAFHYALQCGFLNYDDNVLVTDEPHVKSGINRASVSWALFHSHGLWTPVDTLSHMLDCQLFGMNPHGHHATSLALHVLNVLLLFTLLRKITGAPWCSLFATALFALHPQHVEPVVWISSRKDVLSTFLGLLALLAYAGYAKRQSIARYAVVFLFFVLAVMAKPMLMTLPLVLFLLDYWPLNRADVSSLNPIALLRRNWKLVIEKIPFLLVAAGSVLVTVAAEKGVGALSAEEQCPISLRVPNTMLSYFLYLRRIVWPADLSAFYPHPGPAIGVARPVASLIFLAAVTAATLFYFHRRPYLFVGWFWYLLVLAPVCGLAVQIGSHAMADRYAYVSLIGIYIIIAWGLADLVRRFKPLEIPVTAVAAAIIPILLIATLFQVSYWRDSQTLFEHCLRVTTRNHLAHKNLGAALAEKKKYAEAIAQYVEAAKIRRDDPDLYYNLGNALGDMGKTDDAIAEYQRALKLDPKHTQSYYNLGNAYAKSGKFDDAIAQYATVLQIEPDHLGACINMGNALALTRKPQEAEARYREALRLDPGNEESLTNLGNVLAEQGKLDDAVKSYSEAIRLYPKNTDAYGNLGHALAKQGKWNEAATAFTQVLRLDPTNAAARESLNAIKAQAARP